MQTAKEDDSVVNLTQLANIVIINNKTKMMAKLHQNITLTVFIMTTPFNEQVCHSVKKNFRKKFSNITFVHSLANTSKAAKIS